MSGETATRFRPDDVVRYVPDDEFSRWHCREGTAVAQKRDDGAVVLVDTYWGSGGNNHVLTAAEVATATLSFNLTDYWQVRNEGEWQRYAPDDRARVPSQRGLQVRWLVRKGAVEHLPTQIANARQRLAEAEREAKHAAWMVEWAQRDLDELVPPVSSVLPVGQVNP